MAPKTITNKDQLQEPTEQNPFVVIAALDKRFKPGDEEFETIAQAYGQDNVVFARFFLKEAPELVAHFEISDIDTVITLINGEKGPTVSGFDPDRWKELVMVVIQMQDGN